MDSPARDLFATFLEAHPEAERCQYEAWRAGQRRHGEDLDRLWEELEHLRTVLDLPGESIAAHLIAHHGPGVDPGITLDPSQELRGVDPSIDLTRHLPEGGNGGRRYSVRRELARGGMGVILEVWDRDLRRRVAMKVAHRGALRSLDSRALARFLEEAQITGQLDHPGVVPVHELGLDARGEVFFTMRLVRGRDLESVLREIEAGRHEWTTTRALGVLLRVCEAVAYAHSKGVIHRDLKPANVMVGRFGEVYVMDWGLAKVLGREEPTREEGATRSRIASLREDLEDSGSDSPVFTQDGEVVGTPAYMSPEQAHGDLEVLGPPSDVYAVGAILYRLLAGHRPYHSGVRQTAREVMLAVAAGPPTSVGRLAKDAPAELVAICDKAMAREPGGRYPTMEAMAEDLRAFLEGRVVHAFGSGPLLEFRKWFLRNRLVASVAIAGILAVLGTSVRSALVQAASNSELRETQMHLTSLLSDDLVSRDPARALAVALRTPEGADDYPMRTAVLGAMKRLQEERFLQDLLRVSTPRDGKVLVGWHRTSDTVRIWDVQQRRYVAEYPTPTQGDFLRMDVSPDGLRALVRGSGATWLLDLERGIWTGLGDPRVQVACTAVAFLPVGGRFLTGGEDGRVELWGPDGTRLAELGKHAGVTTTIAVHPSGQVAASLSGSAALSIASDRSLRLWDLGEEPGPGPVVPFEQEPLCVAFHPHEPWILVGDLRGGVRRIDLDTGEDLETSLGFNDRVWSLAIQPQGELFAVGHEEGMALFDMDERPIRIPGYPHGSRGVSKVVFDAGGQRLLSLGFDKCGQTWTLERRANEWNARAAVPARGHYGWVDGGGWIEGQDRFFTNTWRGTHIWYSQTNPHLPRIQGKTRDPVSALAFAPDASRVYIGRQRGGLTAMGFEPGLRLEQAFHRSRPSPDARPLLLGFHRGALLVVWSNGKVECLETSAGEPVTIVAELPGPLLAAEWSEGTGLLLLAAEGGRAAVLNLSTGERRDFVLDAEIESLAIHPRGEMVALGTARGKIVVKSLTGTSQTIYGPLAPQTRGQMGIFGLAFSPTGAELASGGPDGGVRLWNLNTKSSAPAAKFPIGRSVGRVAYVDWDGKLLAQYKWGGDIWVCWSESLTREALGEPARRHRSMISAWVFDVSRTHLLTVSMDQNATWWDLETGRALQTLRGHPAPLTAAALSGDAAWAAIGDEAGVVRLWPLDPVQQGRRAMPYDPMTVNIRTLFPESIGTGEH
jgi:serine/threonine protein kinase/WD40 repeat protein